MISIQVKSDNLKKRREAIQQRIVGIIDQDITLSAKRLAFYLMENTLPKSTASKAWPIENLKGRIWNDVHTVYPTVGDDNWISDAYALIEDNKDKKAANRFYQRAVHLQGKVDESFDENGTYSAKASADTPEEEFAKIRGIPRKIDDKGYSAFLKSKAIKRNGARQLPRDSRPLAMVRAGAADSYARARQKRAGLAKTAWYSAAFALGGQRNYKNSKFEEGRFVWPADCRRIHGQNPGIGGASKRVDIHGGSITLHNRLRYASEAMYPGGIESACDRAKHAMKILFEKRMKAKETWAERSAA